MGALDHACWCKVFCLLEVTVKRSVDQLFMHYFHNFWRVGVVSASVLSADKIDISETLLNL